MKRTTILLAVFIWFTAVLLAQPKAGYYDAANGKSESGLKTALYNIIKNHTDIGYTPGIWNAYATTDINPATGYIWDMYSSCNFTYIDDQDRGSGGGSECELYNREHTVPQSWFNKESPMVSDVFHIVPTDKKVNNVRGNNPFGEVGWATYTSSNGSKLGSSNFSGYSGTVFEPVDEYKGDFARTYFYFATRYEDIMKTIGGDSFNGTTYPAFSTWSVNLFLKWHRQDPVSEKEIKRNNAVEKFQKNRNPFIDHPELAEYIWGNKKGTAWDSSSSSLDDVIINVVIVRNPVQNEIQLQTNEASLTYFIYNINGQLIKSGDVDSSNIISVPELNNGLYLLQLQSGSKKTIQKIIVNNN